VALRKNRAVFPGHVADDVIFSGERQATDRTLKLGFLAAFQPVMAVSVVATRVALSAARTFKLAALKLGRLSALKLEMPVAVVATREAPSTARALKLVALEAAEPVLFGSFCPGLIVFLVLVLLTDPEARRNHSS